MCPEEFTLLFLQFYQSFRISFIEIGVHLNLRQIFGHETNAWVWEGKYLTEILSKLPIFASKAFVSCIFPKNITNFSWKTHVCTMFLIKKFFPWAWKSPKNAHCLPGKGYISHPQVIIFFFLVKKAVLNWFSCFLFKTYIYTTISIKTLLIK